MGDETILSYHDSLLKRSDLKLLSPSQWLNDNIIGFAFEYFEREEFKDCASSVAFISPQVTQCIKLMSVDDARALLEPLLLSDKDVVFFAVNDNRSADIAGGLHWSLLMLTKAEKKCCHYDSARSSNIEAAHELHRRLNPIFDGTLHLMEADTPQQTNSCDCGVYVISLVETLCRRHLNHSLPPAPLSDTVNPTRIKKKRQDLIDLILHLAGGDKLRSTAV